MWRYAVVVVFAIAVGVSDYFAQTAGNKQQYPAAVFAYGEELTPPFTWEGIGEDKLFIVDATGKKALFDPRPTLHKLVTKPLTPEQKEQSARRHELMVQADSAFAVGGIEAMVYTLREHEMVSHVEERDTDLVIHFHEGHPEHFMGSCGTSRSYTPWTKTDSHNFVIRRFEESRAVGASVWFGTDHYITWKADVAALDLFRHAVAKLRAKQELTEEELATFIRNEGLQHDIITREGEP